jgi:V8-like Glu-specific endopeptidase
MMVDAQGHLYAAPPGTQLLSTSAAAGAGGMLDTDLLAPSEATAPVEEAATAGPGKEEDADVMAGQGGSDAPDALAAASADTPASRTRLSGIAAGPLRRLAAIRGSSSRRLAGIIGRDTRQELRSTPRYPLSAAGHLMFTNPDDAQRYQCTGTLVGTYAVLTAAHCVVARTGEVQKDITFTAAETSRNHNGLGVANGLRVYFNSGFVGTGADWTNWDLGMVVLDRPLGVNSRENFEQELMKLKAAVTAHRERGGRSSRRSEGSGRQDSGRQDSGRQESGRQVSGPGAGAGSSSVAGTVGYAASPRLDGTELLSAGGCSQL